MEKFDLTILGGGILGTCLSYWSSLLYEGKIAVLEKEKDVALHTSGRNTGVVHRPFYLNPEKKKVFARSAQISYHLWKKYALLRNLPWKEIGTIEVAVEKEEVNSLEKYMSWALQNGMDESEVEYLSGEQVRAKEPYVHCLGAVFSKTDTSVDYKSFTSSIKEEARDQGVDFLFNFEVGKIFVENELLKIVNSRDGSIIETKFLINCLGGQAIDCAHKMRVGMEYTDLHFRGEYWQIHPDQAKCIERNIYSVPRHKELPFLDPHWIVRSDGRREIGPNAVLVSGAETYSGFFNSAGELLKKIFERPMTNKFKLFTNPEFLKLAKEEWMSSISKKNMLKRVQRFIPHLKSNFLIQKGSAGVRSSVIDPNGCFAKEVVELESPTSYHILNYNSPGATGAPAYTAFLIDKLEKKGLLKGLKKRKIGLKSFWDYEEIMENFNF
ncbi:MAG: hypothetical protein A3I11_03885 [Elusimicrobia bacterium RIFCSPLOWO2_02_FULL_39_32]|nr:MAG: hypothetical protein A3B80_02460 [Elusimicrobia bacterium RIFCSPHIGHO2_02_FULL_39_36]OGR92846.1 MAG: hypothetical protein A3I11_03885 [Elusimicrobia bacterium RIFCSPLOWO2_02_FULL_39_32]OGR99631.1 MAG: hypothetical protein A3G85_01250 [Elusimicrobia bacterium RIFCSPLOWO2_12_FULL_39_28]